MLDAPGHSSDSRHMTRLTRVIRHGPVSAAPYLQCHTRHPISSVIRVTAPSPETSQQRSRHPRPPLHLLYTSQLRSRHPAPPNRGLVTQPLIFLLPPLSGVAGCRCCILYFTFLVSCNKIGEPRILHLSPLISHLSPRPLPIPPTPHPGLLLCLVLQDAGVGELTLFTLMDATIRQT